MSEVTRSETDDETDITDELPVLSEAAIVSVGEREARRAETEDEDAVRVPFPKLQRRREFEQRIASLEGRVGSRDAAVDDLERRVGTIARGWETVETQLGRNAAAVESLAEQLASLREQLGRAPGDGESRAGGRDAAGLADARAERDTAARARAEAEAELETLHRRLGDRETELEHARTRLAELEAASEGGATASATRDADDARAELAALTDYITNRREHWDALQARVDEQAERIRELETELEQRVARQHDAEELAARESARAVEYRDELARHAARAAGAAPPGEAAAAADAAGGSLGDFEHALVELRGTLDAQRDALDAASDAPDADAADDVHERLRAAEADVERARADLQRLEAALHERERAADEQSGRVAAFQNQLAAQVDRLRDLQNVADGANADARDGADAHASDDTGDEDAAAATGSLEAVAAELRRDEPADDVPERGALVCLTSNRPEHYSIAKREMLIGRSTEADIRIATHFVSREHARLRNDGRAVFIDDLGSTNGVFVNSIRVDSQELHDGDWVTIGETQFRYIANMP